MGATALLLLAVALPCITALHTQLHKHMSPDELRNVFHVEDHSLVPEYQVIQLNHHVSKRHVASATDSRYHTGNTIHSGSGKKSAHDKLSGAEVQIKNAHKFAGLGFAYNYPPAVVDHIGSTRYSNKINEEPFSLDSLSDSASGVEILSQKRTNSEPQESANDSDKFVNVNGDSISQVVINGDAIVENNDRVKNSGKFEDVEHLDESLEDGVHRIKFEAFGRPIELVLRKTEGLFKKNGLKLFTVVGNETQPHGVEFVESEADDDTDDIGETYQDEETQTALVIRRDPHAGGLLVDGSIGHDLVIKPLPSTLSTKISRTKINPSTIPPDQDDEMFMDANQDDMVSIDTGLPIKKHAHVKKNLATEKPDDAMAGDVKNGGINKMDDEEGIIYDDEGAKEESRRFYGSRRVTREAVIEALSGARHVIFKRDVIDDHNEELSDYAFMEPDRLGKRFQRQKRSSDYEVTSDSHSNRRAKREAPYVIYPEILVIVDYDGYRLHGGDNLQIKRYFVSFWNGVDLRYKLLKGPKIRISIAGIIISRGRDATPYLERNRVGRDAIDSAAALTDMGKYLFRERRLPVYDIAVAVTKLDMCRRQYANDVCNRGTAGFAYVGGACVVNKRLEKVNSVAIIEDTGGFSGIIVAAHEVGHLLGAVHDGSPPPSYLGGPGAEKCRWEDGFIMSDLRHTEKGFRWSPCSVLSFHHFLNGDTATCLYNSPHEDESLPRVLPGKLLSLDAQCRKDRGTSACFKDERVCAQLFCFDSGSGYCVAYRPAAEGSPCGDGQYCINGRCVAEHENIIPDYSHHTPSYIRRDTSPYYGNDTVHRYLLDQTTQAYGTYPSSPYQQTHYYYPSTGQSPQTYVQPQSVDPYSPYTTQTPYQVVYNTFPVTKQSYPYSPLYSTTRNPYDFRNFQLYQYTAETKQTQYTLPSSSSSSRTASTEATTTTTRTTPSPFFFKYSYSSTKNPYDFKEFATKRPFTKVTTVKENGTSNTIATTTQRSIFSISTTRSTFSTTKQKYGFINKLDLRNYFNRTTTKNPYDFDLTNYKEIPNNNIKRSYSIGSYYGSQNRPVANYAQPNATSVAHASENVAVVQQTANETSLVSPQ